MNPNQGGRIEPHADLRQMATVTYQIFFAFREAGFDVEQSMRLTIAQITRPTGGTQ